MRRETLLRNVLWRVIPGPGLEYCSLWTAGGEGFQIDGTVLTVHGARPLRVRYAVQCDPGWRTQAVFVESRLGKEQHTLKMSVDAEQRWWASDGEVEVLAGCVDVDLGISPCTNTLPIRRLDLGIGESGVTRAAWILFPDLSLQADEQRYTRLEERIYLYESGSARRHIEVDDLGLAIRYEDGWERVAESAT